jgi:low affinity Fe/Cu permease
MGNTTAPQSRTLQATFSRVAKDCASAMGQPWAFLLACSTIVAWAMTGPLFGYSDTWQLVINTGTTIITFLMVFLIQNTQNRDSCAIQVKLDELLRSTKGAHNALLDLEELTQAELDEFAKNYRALAHEARKRVREGLQDIGTPDVRKTVAARSFKS